MNQTQGRGKGGGRQGSVYAITGTALLNPCLFPQPSSFPHHCGLPHHTHCSPGLCSHLRVVPARSPGPYAGSPIHSWYEGSAQRLPGLPGEVWLEGWGS